MKKNAFYFLFLLFSLFLYTGCQSKQKARSEDFSSPAQISWTQKEHHFGKLSEGETVSHTFTFENIGDHYFVIKNVDSGCSCTTVHYDKSPVAPGKTGKITLEFNSAGRYGKQYKEIRIFANVPEKEIILKFTANVIPDGNQ